MATEAETALPEDEKFLAEMPEFLAESPKTSQFDEILQRMGIVETAKTCKVQQSEGEKTEKSGIARICPLCHTDLTIAQDNRPDPARYLCCVPCRHIESWWYVREDK